MFLPETNAFDIKNETELLSKGPCVYIMFGDKCF